MELLHVVDNLKLKKEVRWTLSLLTTRHHQILPCLIFVDCVVVNQAIGS
jgi:hypothetical protein